MKRLPASFVKYNRFAKIVLLRNFDRQIRNSLKKGLVIKSTGSWYTVKDGDSIIPCRIKGKFRTKGIKTTNPIAVGDKVGYEMHNDGKGIIVSLEDRTNYIIRRSTSFHHEGHLLAANIDQVLLLITLKMPVTFPEFIDRFLVTAEAYHIKATLIINKSDLLTDADLPLFHELKDTYEKAGYKCLPVSLITDEGIMDVINILKGRITLIAGNSGVGKTTLINRLAPHLQLKTAEVSAAHKAGKHTTTFYELFTLDTDTYVIDSPGIKGFGLIDFSGQEIGLFFPEIFHISKNCKFYNCSHLHEPGCAVREAVKDGNIGETRYKSYVNMIMDEDEKYRK